MPNADEDVVNLRDNLDQIIADYDAVSSNIKAYNTSNQPNCKITAPDDRMTKYRRVIGVKYNPQLWKDLYQRSRADKASAAQQIIEKQHFADINVARHTTDHPRSIKLRAQAQVSILKTETTTKTKRLTDKRGL